MPTIELNEAELAATIEALRRFIDEDPFPRAPHHDALPRRPHKARKDLPDTKPKTEKAASRGCA
jgi:hypothetical protein